MYIYVEKLGLQFCRLMTYKDDCIELLVFMGTKVRVGGRHADVYCSFAFFSSDIRFCHALLT